MSDEQKSGTVDLRGLVCPEPVLKTKKLLDDQSIKSVQALVDSDVNVNNLARLARSFGFSFKSAPEDGSFRVTIERSADASAGRGAGSASAHQEPHHHAPVQSASLMTGSTTGTNTGAVILINKDTFGEGDREFSAQLLNIYLQTIFQSGHRPRAILLANTGVKLMHPDSASVRVLQEFKEAGCEVLACGLCVEYYGLQEHVPKDQITNMFAITEYLFAAERVLMP